MLAISEKCYSATRQPRHAHGETTATIILSGHLRECVGAREETASALSVVFKPRDTEHADDFSNGVRTLQIVLDDATSAWFDAQDSHCRQWRWEHCSPSSRAFLRLLFIQRAAERDDPRVQVAAHDALASLATDLRSTGRANAPQWLKQIAEELEESPCADSVTAIAQRAGVHPVYLARAFRRHMGCSITEQLGRNRPRRAIALMESATSTLSRVAMDAGYSDHAHMSRAFMRHTGFTPRDLRRMIAGK